ncbi:MAG TPA: citryl-CoA lyase [Hydrogenothermaceae bacterium]|nr:citryl-CoA lyase [Hydrogenothermaceae bacterium]
MWRTAISTHIGTKALVRGYELEELIGNLTFTEAIYLVLKGELPTEKERKMLDVMFVATIEHSIAPPSIIAARAVISGGNSLNVGVGAGILAFGSAHGGALEDIMKLLQENIDKTADKIVKEYLSQGKRIPGFGHRFFKDFDPRAKKILSFAKELGFYGKYCKLAEDMDRDPLSYNALITRTIAIAYALKGITEEAEHVGVFLPNSTSSVKIDPISYFS